MNTPTRAARAAAMHRHLEERRGFIEYCVERIVGVGFGVRDDDPTDWRDHHWMTVTQSHSHMGGCVCAIWWAHAGTPRYTDYEPPSMETVDREEIEHALNIRCVRQYLVREKRWRAGEIDRALDDLVDDEAIRLVAEGEGDVRIELVKRLDLE